jgi:protein-tyrosine-phosphatase
MEGARHPGAVLFVCSLNRTRSPMAAALMRELHGDKVYVDSCGIEAGPGLDPLVSEVLAEARIDAPSREPRTFDELEGDSFDLIVSLTPEAQARVAERLRGRAAELEYWPIFDPTEAEGSRDVILDAYRQLRDHLQHRIRERFGAPSTRSDPVGYDLSS